MTGREEEKGLIERGWREAEKEREENELKRMRIGTRDLTMRYTDSSGGDNNKCYHNTVKT